MKKHLCSWAITFMVISFGLIPYKFPKKYSNLDNQQLLVNHEECTCCQDFYIKEGGITIPTPFKKYFPNTIYELTITGDTTPLNNFELLNAGDFVIKGKVVGVDSIYCDPTPIFEISYWAPTQYSANFRTFGFVEFIFYFAASVGLTIFSITLTANFRKKR